MQGKFSADEYLAVARRAAAAGLTVPSYLAVAGMRPEGVESTDVKAAVTYLSGAQRVLAGAANNLTN